MLFVLNAVGTIWKTQSPTSTIARDLLTEH